MSEDSYESALVTELQALAGVASGTHEFAVGVGGQAITVHYHQWSSGPSDLSLVASYDDAARVGRAPQPGAYGHHDVTRAPLVAVRPLAIELRPEHGEDRAAKRDGLNREWQTGDPAFDAAVYVSTRTDSPHVLAAVLGPDMRRAVLELFSLGFRRVCIDEDHLVRAEVTEFVIQAPHQGRGRLAIEAFARVLGSLPAVVASGASHPEPPLAGTTRTLQWLAVLFGLLFGLQFAGMLYVVVGAHAVSPVTDPAGSLLRLLTAVLGPWLAFGCGLVPYRLARKSYSRAVANAARGTSLAAEDAKRGGQIAGACALFLTANVAFGALCFVVLVVLAP